MAMAIRAGVYLGVLVTIWQYLMGFTGWYKDPVLLNLFFLVIVFEIALLLWALKRTAPFESYGGQMVNGLVFSLVAGAIVVCSSLVFTTSSFPHYFEEMQAMQARALAAQGLSKPDIDLQLAAAAAMQTPAMNALSGFIGTLVTGLLVSAIAAIFWRKK